MLTVCYSPKGGQGCTTVTAALALAQRGSRLIDATGDLPAVLGLPEPSGPGICDLLADGYPIKVAAIERLANPGAGAVAEPSLLVSPPALSSRSDVNTTGAASVPAATNTPDPDTPSSAAPDFTIVPGATVKVTPSARLSPVGKSPRPSPPLDRV